MKKITSSDVAKLAGVSQSTVSFVLNGRTDISISDETHKKVFDAAKQLNYVIGGFTKAPKSSKTKTIGMMIPNLSNPYYPMLVQLIQKYVSENGYNLLICSINRIKSEEKFYLRYFAEHDVDGVIFAFTPDDPGYVNSYSKRLPVVILGEADKRFKIPTIELDSTKSGGLIADYLTGLGHKKIAFITTPINSITLSRKKRLEGVKKALENSGEHDFYVKAAEYEREIFDSDFDKETGYQFTKELLSEKSVSAIIGVNDMVAYGAMCAVLDLGIKVPEDISICGFDNLYLSKIVSPGITTVDHLISERCRRAVLVIIDMIEKHNREVFRMVYEPKLIIRESTAAARLL